MSVRLVVQLITPQVLSGVKVEDALDNAIGAISNSTHEEVLRSIRAFTGGIEVDRWLMARKIKPSATSRIEFLKNFQ